MAKRRDIKDIVKGQPLFNTHLTFLIDYKLKFPGFAVENFTVLLVSQNLPQLPSVFIFYKLSAGDCSVFRVIWKQPFRITFLFISKNGFFPLRKGKFSAGL